MILFGDLDFFTSEAIKNRQGRSTWNHFKSLLEAGGHVYRDGLPVLCEKHKTHADLSDPDAFHREAQDGGCRLQCGATLACGHICPRRQVLHGTIMYMSFDPPRVSILRRTVLCIGRTWAPRTGLQRQLATCQPA